MVLINSNADLNQTVTRALKREFSALSLRSILPWSLKFPRRIHLIKKRYAVDVLLSYRGRLVQ